MTDVQLTTIQTIAWAVVALALVQAVTVYSVIRLITSGRTLFERKPEEGPRRIHVAN